MFSASNSKHKSRSSISLIEDIAKKTVTKNNTQEKRLTTQSVE